MNAEKFSALLQKIDSCAKVKKWAKRKTLAEAWADCEKADWMLRLAGKMAGQDGWPTKYEIVRCAALCAETVLYLVPEGETRPRAAIDAALAWADNPSMQNRLAAAHSAYAAAHAANAIYAAYSTYYDGDGAAAAYATVAAYYAATNATETALALAAVTVIGKITDAVSLVDGEVEQHKIMCGLIRNNLDVSPGDK